ncbi:MAG: hypothetical protein JWN78_3063 [Bacteroidota bacterium]|nr:hypothetical protein [Bacteroidota bacterium]
MGVVLLEVGVQLVAENYVIYSGTNGGPITVTNLTPNTEYYFKIFEANCSNSDIVYNSRVASDNPISQRTITTVGIIDHINSEKLKIYLNPNTGQFIIDMDVAKSGNLKINITDMLGRNILTQTSYVSGTKNKIPVQLSGIANGSYLMNLEFNGEIYKKKIVVTK